MQCDKAEFKKRTTRVVYGTRRQKQSVGTLGGGLLRVSDDDPTHHDGEVGVKKNSRELIVNLVVSFEPKTKT